MKLARLLGKRLHAVVGRQAIHLEQVAMLLDHLECLGADATGRTENGYLFLHFLLDDMSYMVEKIDGQGL